MEFQMRTDDQEKARWPIVRLVRGIVKRVGIIHNIQFSNYCNSVLSCVLMRICAEWN